MNTAPANHRCAPPGRRNSGTTAARTSGNAMRSLKRSIAAASTGLRGWPFFGDEDACDVGVGVGSGGAVTARSWRARRHSSRTEGPEVSAARARARHLPVDQVLGDDAVDAVVAV